MKKGTNTTEHPQGRVAMDRMQKTLVEHGVDHKEAKRIARESALRVDRNNEKP